MDRKTEVDELRRDLETRWYSIQDDSEPPVGDSSEGPTAAELPTCACIHGDRTQSEREQALNEFRSGSARLLIATDVASRGIQILRIHNATTIFHDFSSTTALPKQTQVILD